MADNHPDDNIADTTNNPNVPPVDDAAADEYMKKFDVVEARLQRCATGLRALSNQPDQDHRLFALMRLADDQQKLNEQLFDLLVEMNNFFAPK